MTETLEHTGEAGKTGSAGGTPPAGGSGRAFHSEDTAQPASGRRAPVQGDRLMPPGSVAWDEYEKAWLRYAGRYPGQSAARIAAVRAYGDQRATDALARVVDWLHHRCDYAQPSGRCSACSYASVIARMAEAEVTRG